MNINKYINTQFKAVSGFAFAFSIAQQWSLRTLRLLVRLQGGTSQVGRTLAAAISDVGELQMRPQELANTADYSFGKCR